MSVELNEEMKAYITGPRADIDLISWDDAYQVDYQEDHAGEGVWFVPVEALFDPEKDGCSADSAGWHHGTMEIEIDENDVLDFYVGNWQMGMHPDLHTFER